MSQPLHAHVGTRLAELRAARGLTVEELAIAAGVVSDDVQRYEAGERIPIGKLWALTKGLRISIAALFVDWDRRRPVQEQTVATVDEGLALLAAFRAIDDARLRAVLIDIADHFTRRDEN